jgi:cysteine-rich repeat protein
VKAGAPASDTPLPANGTPFGRVAGEGALSAFVGEDPNGTWTLTVADDNRNGQSGTLEGFTLAITTASSCGDGTVDAGEQCDDGNAAEGDGCDSNCTPSACGNGVLAPGEECDDGNNLGGDACPALCHFSEVNCGDCLDDDGNRLIDAADPAVPGRRAGSAPCDRPDRPRQAQADGGPARPRRHRAAPRPSSQRRERSHSVRAARHPAEGRRRAQGRERRRRRAYVARRADA